VCVSSLCLTWCERLCRACIMWMSCFVVSCQKHVAQRKPPLLPLLTACVPNRYLHDPEGQALFVAQRLEAAAASGSSAAGAADTTTTSSSSRLVGSKGLPLGAAASPTGAAQGSKSLAGWAPSQQQQGLHKSLRAKGLDTAAEGVDGGPGIGSTSARSSCSSSSAGGIVGSFGLYSAWALIDLLMAEWVNRVAANAQSMAALRR
jgi:hypothetical protein